MKYKVLPLFLLFTIGLLFHQPLAAYATASPEIVITGKLSNYDKQQFSLSYDVFTMLGESHNKNVKMDEQGNFRAVIKTSHPFLGKLGFGRVMKDNVGHYREIYLYLEPGDSLNVKADVNNIQKTLTFSGQGVDNNKFVNQEKFKFHSYKHRVLNNHHYIANNPPERYTAIVDSVRDKKAAFLKDYAASHSISSKLVTTYQYKFENLAVVRKINYPKSHKRFNDGEEAKLPSDYYDFMKHVTIASSLDNIGTDYMRFLNYYLQTKYKLAEKKGYEKTYPEFAQSQLSGRPLYIYYAYYLGRDFRPDVFNKFDKGCPYPDLAQMVRIKYKNLKSMLPGEPAPDAILTDVKGNNKSFSSFQGQYVYVDFWATWCKPCIEQIPYLDKLKEEYKGRNIEFLSISFDREEDVGKWKNFVMEHNLTGAQYWVDAKNHKLISKTFNIRVIPRFVLIDDAGKIVDAKAPRPSETKKVHSLIDSELDNEK